ncbi:sulfurtransferase complex subunit TusC [methane-oxidizing endosymbiont of Gigantopelta aegis]|uniref:sulfurtransferase complex subunit TusC n=1 Tax=methane-oxidizing endosymbiont of Gigantopelta aegis TaxID=2794938 RepID=UPI0018DE3103|nr:sulfurtransferase complex subunit TusC [methane-oxidizing endosymbiont of Gigantopelta aegis]
MKKILFVLEKPPFQGIKLQENLDMILTAAVFDQQVALLFLGGGVLSIKSGQNPTDLGLKDTAAIFKALEIYDVKDFYVEVESLQAFGLKPGDLIFPVQEIYRKDVNAMIVESDVVLSAG